MSSLEELRSCGPSARQATRARGTAPGEQEPGREIAEPSQPPGRSLSTQRPVRPPHRASLLRDRRSQMEGLAGPTPRLTPSFASQGPPLTWALGKVLGASVARLAGPELRRVAGPEQWGAVGLVQLCKTKSFVCGAGGQSRWAFQSPATGSVFSLIVHLSSSLNPERREKNLPPSRQLGYNSEGALDLELNHLIHSPAPPCINCVTSDKRIDLPEPVSFVSSHFKAWFYQAIENRLESCWHLTDNFKNNLLGFPWWSRG